MLSHAALAFADSGSFVETGAALVGLKPVQRYGWQRTHIESVDVSGVCQLSGPLLVFGNG